MLIQCFSMAVVTSGASKLWICCLALNSSLELPSQWHRCAQKSVTVIALASLAETVSLVWMGCARQIIALAMVARQVVEAIVPWTVKASVCFAILDTLLWMELAT